VPQSPLLGPSYSLFTDGSASTSPPFAAGWGLHSLDPTGCVTHEDWGSVCLDPSSPEFVGASRYTNNSGELTALIPAFKWICTSPSHSPLQLNLYTTLTMRRNTSFSLRISRLPTRVLLRKRVVFWTRLVRFIRCLWFRPRLIPSKTSWWRAEIGRLTLSLFSAGGSLLGR